MRTDVIHTDQEFIASTGFVLSEPDYEIFGDDWRRHEGYVIWKDPFPSKYSKLFKELFFETVIANGVIFTDVVVCRPGFETDGATIPKKPAWIRKVAKWLGIEPYGKLWMPASIHDRQYETLWCALEGGEINLIEFRDLRDEADWMFEDCVSYQGFCEWQSNLLYIIVKNLGYIQWVREQQQEYHESINNHLVGN